MKCAASVCLLINAAWAEHGIAAAPVNLASPGTVLALRAIPDAVWGLTNCTIAAGSTLVTCPAPATYTMPNSAGANAAAYVPKVVIDDAGSSGGATPQMIPLVSVITGATITTGGALQLTIATPASFSNLGTIANHVALLNTDAGGTGYHFGSTQTLVCGSCSPGTDGDVGAVGTPAVMTETGSATIPTGSTGTGGTSGACTISPAAQIGLGGNLTEFYGVVSGGSLTTVSVIQAGAITNDLGSYNASTGIYTDRLVGCGFTPTTGPKVQFRYAIVSEQLTSGTGIYPFSPPCNVGGGETFTTSLGDFGSGFAADCVNTAASQLTFPGTVSYGTDNTAAFQAALGVRNSAAAGTMNAAAAVGQPQCLDVPAGNYLIQPLNAYSSVANQASGSFLAQGYGCWLGDEHYHSNIFVIPNIQGDVFAWTDANQNNSLPQLGQTQTFQNLGSAVAPYTGANQAGSSFRNISIIGDRLSTEPQNGLALYGKTEFAYFDNIVVDFLFGRAFYAGGADASGIGDFNESVVQNVRFEDDGCTQGVATTTCPVANTPAMDITATGGTEGSNTDSLQNLRIYQALGTGLWLHSQSTSNLATRYFRLGNIFIEGSKTSGQSSNGDLLEIGDAAASPNNNVTEVVGRNIQLLNPALGHAALRITGHSYADTGNIDIQGAISGNTTVDPGRGVQIEACNQCAVKMADNSTGDYPLVIGSTTSTAVCGSSSIGVLGVIYDGDGYEAGLNSCIDPAAAGLVQYPARHTITSGVTFPAFTSPLADINLVGSLTGTATTGGTITMGSTGILPIRASETNWTLIRSGPTAAFADSWDTAGHIITQLGTPASGLFYRMRVCNDTNFVDTISPQGSSGVTGIITVPGTTCEPINMTIINSGSVGFSAG